MEEIRPQLHQCKRSEKGYRISEDETLKNMLFCLNECMKKDEFECCFHIVKTLYFSWSMEELVKMPMQNKVIMVSANEQ